MYKLAGGVLVLVILAVLGLLAAPAVVDWNAYRDDLESTLHEVTGLEIDIQGDLDISFLPSPRVTASDVTWTAGAVRQPLLRIPELRASVALGELIGGEFRITDISMLGPQALLVLDEAGRPVFAAADGDGAAAQPDGEPAAGFLLDRVEVQGGTLVVERRSAPDDPVVIEDLHGVVTASASSGRIGLKGRGSIAEQAIDYSASVGRIRADQPVPLRWSVGLSDAGLSLSFNGALEGTLSDAVAVGKVQVDADRLAALFGLLELPLAAPADGQARLAAQARLSTLDVALSEIDFSTGGVSAKGAATLALGPRPKAQADLSFSRIDLDRFAAGGRVDVGRSLAAVLGGLADADPSLLPDGLDMELQVRADALQVGGAVVHNADLAIELAQDALFVERAAILLPGGSDFSLNGVFERDDAGLSFEGPLAVTSDNLRALMAWVGLAAERVPPARLRALDVSGVLRTGPGSVALDGLTSVVDATKASGRIALSTGEQPRFEIDLAVDSFSLDAYRLRDRTGTEPRREKGERSDPFGVFTSTDGEVRLGFDRLTVLGQPLERVTFQAVSSAGELDVHTIQVADYAGLSLDGSLMLSARAGQPQIGFEIATQSRDPERLLRHLGLYPTAATRRLTGATLDLRGEGDLELVTFSAESSLAGGDIAIDGGVADPFGGAQLTAEIQANHPTPVQLVRALGLPGISAADTAGLTEGGALRMTAMARAAGDRVSIDIASLTVGATEVAGQANLDLSAVRPELDLVIVASDVSGVGLLAVLSSVQRATDVTLDLEADRLTVGTVAIDGASARAKMTEAMAVVGPVRGETMGGSVDVMVSVGAEAGRDRIEGKIAATDLNPGALLKAAGGPAALSGSLALRSEFTAHGRTVNEYLASVAGRVEMDGTIQLEPAQNGSGRYAAGLLGENLPPIRQVSDLSEVLKSAFGDRGAPVNVVITVDQGIARTEAAQVNGTGARAISYGTWDIAGQRLETTIDVIRGEAQETPYFTLGLVGPPRTPNVRIAGAWLNPR